MRGSKGPLTGRAPTITFPVVGTCQGSTPRRPPRKLPLALVACKIEVKGGTMPKTMSCWCDAALRTGFCGDEPRRFRRH